MGWDMVLVGFDSVMVGGGGRGFKALKGMSAQKYFFWTASLSGLQNKMESLPIHVILLKVAQK